MRKKSTRKEKRERIGEKSKPFFLSFQERRDKSLLERNFVTNEKISEKSNEKKKNETQKTKSS